MLREVHPQQRRFARPVDESDIVSVAPHFSGILRRKRLIFRVTLLFVILGILFAALRQDSFTAITKLLIDNKTLQLSRQDAVFARSEVDVPLIQNQIELLRSEKIANQVIDRFKLMEDPDFGARGFFLKPRNPEDDRRLALEAFKRRLYVGRVGDSYTLEIRFTASVPERAAAIANQIGSDYIDLLAESNAKLAQSASPWLRARLKDMGPNASVITAATPPLRRDGPSFSALVAIALLAGLLFGVTGALAADMRDRSIRTPPQVAAATSAECMGIVPKLKGRDLLLEAVKSPKSYLTHTLRRAVAVIREQPDVKIVGIVSAVPGEGKTTIAANLAQVAVTSGSRVLLIDGAAYGGRLSRLLAPTAKAGLAEVLAKELPFANAVWSISQLKFLPIGSQSELNFERPGSLSEIQYVFSEAGAAFDLVVVDLPPLTLVADVREVASAFDGFLLVIEWGTTPQDVITSALATNEPVQRKLLGAILNKVEVNTLKTYGESLSVIYDYTRYSGYLGNRGFARRLGWFGRRKKGAA